MLADSYPFLDIMWTMFIFFAWVIWVAFLVFILVDNFKRTDHSGAAKAGWTNATTAMTPNSSASAIRPTRHQPCDIGIEISSSIAPAIQTTPNSTETAVTLV